MKLLIHWSLGMDKQFHPPFYNGGNYSSLLGLKLNHVSKRGPGVRAMSTIFLVRIWPVSDVLVSCRWFSHKFIWALNVNKLCWCHQGVLPFLCRWYNWVLYFVWFAWSMHDVLQIPLVNDAVNCTLMQRLKLFWRKCKPTFSNFSLSFSDRKVLVQIWRFVYQNISWNTSILTTCHPSN